MKQFIINISRLLYSRICTFAYLHIIVLLFLTFSISCKKTKPQLPSNKDVNREVVTIDMARINKELIQKEDSIIQLYINENDKSYHKSDIGFWYKFNRKTQRNRLRKDNIYLINYEIYLLDGSLVERRDNVKVTLGKKEIIPGLDAALLLMRVGESASFIFPWNLAFGLKGYPQQVPPYTSVVFNVEALE